jgi:hypothetical protein
MSWVIPRPIRDFVSGFGYFYELNRPRSQEEQQLVNMHAGMYTILPVTQNLVEVTIRTAAAGTLALAVYRGILAEGVGVLCTGIGLPSAVMLYGSGKAALWGLRYLFSANGTGSLAEAGIGLACLAGGYVLGECHDFTILGNAVKEKMNLFPGENILSNNSEGAARTVLHLTLR